MATYSPDLDPSLHQRIEQLAYKYWVEQGRPANSSTTDWLRAEEEIRFEVYGPAKREM